MSGISIREIPVCITRCGSDWSDLVAQWAIAYARFIVGEPPGCELGLVWHDHDGSDVGDVIGYATIGVWLNDAASSVPQDYLWKWELALSEFEEAVEWGRISPDEIGLRIEGEELQLREQEEKRLREEEEEQRMDEEEQHQRELDDLTICREQDQLSLGLGDRGAETDPRRTRYGSAHVWRVQDSSNVPSSSL